MRVIIVKVCAAFGLMVSDTIRRQCACPSLHERCESRQRASSMLNPTGLSTVSLEDTTIEHADNMAEIQRRIRLFFHCL